MEWFWFWFWFTYSGLVTISIGGFGHPVESQFDEFNMFGHTDLQDVPDEINSFIPINIIVPTTKWCGPGNIAANYNDLGISADVDYCCREHDNCNDLITAGSSKNNLHNYGMFTMLNCKCEKTFMQCLQQSSSFLATTIAYGYYLLQHQCYGYGHPIEKCQVYQKWGKISKRCVIYRVDKSKPKVWQFYDMPFYRKFNRTEEIPSKYLKYYHKYMST